MNGRAAIIHRVVSVGIAAAIPAAVLWVNGEIGLEFIVLGAAIGFATWYWGPSVPPL